MLLVTELFKWWYTAGLRQRLKKISVRLDGTIDYFSMDLLVKTLFAPFRQISAGKVDGSLEVKMRALIDRLFSRHILLARENSKHIDISTKYPLPTTK